MPLIEWEDRFSLHDEMIDKHHRRLVELLNGFYDDFISGASAERLGAVLHELINYATYHFYTEEKAMEEKGYPGLQAHRLEHALFVEKVVGIQLDFHHGKQDLSVETITFLVEWITHHILENDILFWEFVAGGNNPKP